MYCLLCVPRSTFMEWFSSFWVPHLYYFWFSTRPKSSDNLLGTVWNQLCLCDSKDHIAEDRNLCGIIQIPRHKLGTWEVKTSLVSEILSNVRKQFPARSMIAFSAWGWMQTPSGLLHLLWIITYFMLTCDFHTQSLVWRNSNTRYLLWNVLLKS